MFLREKDKKLIVSLCRSCFQSPMELWAYGSRVNGSAHEASDLDTVIVPTADPQEILNFSRELKDSNLPIIVDVLVWDKIPQVFKESIQAQYEVLFSNLKTYPSDLVEE